ncbi:MAG: long-chain fatty acid--CoA ligase, partial [Pseudomonadota bacterium]
MQGIMQDWPLTVDKILEHARLQNADREIITRRVEGNIVRTTYGELYDVSKQVSNALKDAAMWRAEFQPSVATRSPRPMPSSF